MSCPDHSKAARCRTSKASLVLQAECGSIEVCGCRRIQQHLDSISLAINYKPIE
ncbi:unnamed protein product [Musa acuminata subsp. burmannicoides]